MSTITVQCNVEATKSDKWLRLAPVDKSPIGPLFVKADEAGAAKTATITVKLNAR